MADRPKKKQTYGQRNEERRNGKAFKKNPKQPKRKERTIEQIMERNELAAQRKAARREAYLARVEAEKQARLRAKAEAELAREKEEAAKAAAEARRVRIAAAQKQHESARAAAAKLHAASMVKN